MLQNNDVDIKQLIQLTDSGLSVATFTQIRNAIIKRYKAAYGSDIDVSTNTADGVFVNDLALIMNNILQTVSSIYSNLDVNTASGKYLDILCNLSNLTRKSATKSTASVKVTALTNTITIPANALFIDIAGQIWIGQNSEIALSKGQSATIEVVANEAGPIKAKAGSINAMVDSGLTVSVEQANDAIVGSNAETDEELRSRRASYGSLAGTTVLDSLSAALLDVSGIKDVKIYNNNTSENDTALDNTVVNPHNIYVIVRQDGTVDDSIIGSIIYNKITPGIGTTDAAEEKHHYDYKTIINGFEITVAKTTIYWKQAKAIPASFTITLKKLTDYDDVTCKAAIINALKDYLSNVRIGETPGTGQLLTVIQSADPMPTGVASYIVNSCTGAITNNDNYYQLGDITWSIS